MDLGGAGRQGDRAVRGLGVGRVVRVGRGHLGADAFAPGRQLRGQRPRPVRAASRRGCCSPWRRGPGRTARGGRSRSIRSASSRRRGPRRRAGRPGCCSAGSASRGRAARAAWPSVSSGARLTPSTAGASAACRPQRAFTVANRSALQTGVSSTPGCDRARPADDQGDADAAFVEPALPLAQGRVDRRRRVRPFERRQAAVVAGEDDERACRSGSSSSSLATIRPTLSSRLSSIAA